MKTGSETLDRAVFLQRLDDAKQDAAYENFVLKRPDVAQRLAGVRDSLASHRAVYDERARLGVEKGQRLTPFLGVKADLNRPIGGQLVFTGKSLVRIGDADDQTPIFTPFPAKEILERNHFSEAERAFLEHAEAETGMGVSPEELERQQKDRLEIRKQSHALAHKLELSGREAYRNEALGLWTYWVHSKTWEAIPKFRRICLLPYIAAMVRAPKLAALEYFLSQNPFARFWTFTSGKRVGLKGLRSRIQYLHHRLNRLNALLRERYEMELVFRSTELGSVEFDETGKRAETDGAIEFDANGDPLFHVHAHCVLVSKRKTPRSREQWQGIIKAVGEFWVHHWDAGNIIRDARECCKYVTKPGDMLKLTPDQLGRLADAVAHLKLCQPLGVLADEIRARKEAGKTLRRYRTREGMVWREVFDQNKCVQIDEEERWAADNLRDAQKMTAETLAASRVPPGVTPRLPEKNADWCRVFARLSPAAGPCGLKEPRVIVGGTRFDLGQVQRHELVKQLWSNTIEAWEAGRAIRVHTGTPTVRDFSFAGDVEERLRPPDPAEIEAAAEIGSVLEQTAWHEAEQMEFAK